VSVAREGMGCREEEGRERKNAYQTTFMCSCALVGGGEGGRGRLAVLGREDRGANALRRERRRAYSYCSCPPVNKGLIWVRM